jgi:hypothetical protein
MEVVKMAYNNLSFIRHLARSLVYQGLYDALQKILGYGTTKEEAEKLILDVCYFIFDDKENLSAILEEKRYKHPYLACSLFDNKENLSAILEEKRYKHPYLACSLVYQGLYDALQQILCGGATKEEAEKLILDVCHFIFDSKENLSAILEKKRYKHPLS